MLVETAVPELDPDVLYEACPRCWDSDPIVHGGCMVCWDQQIVPHACGGEGE